MNVNSNNIKKLNNEEKILIIVVDDNSIINDSMKKLIEIVLNGKKILYEILMLTDGLDVLKFLLSDNDKKSSVRFIFTDENMDYLSGSEAISIIRIWEKAEKLKNINIISITCHEDPKTVNHILSKGADKVLAKPITKSLVLSTFKTFGLIDN